MDPIHTVFSVGGELLTSTWSKLQLWKEYFEDLLNSAGMYSKEQAAPKDSGLGSLIIGVEVAMAFK